MLNCCERLTTSWCAVYISTLVWTVDAFWNECRSLIHVVLKCFVEPPQHALQTSALNCGASSFIMSKKTFLSLVYCSWICVCVGLAATPTFRAASAHWPIRPHRASVALVLKVRAAVSVAAHRLVEVALGVKVLSRRKCYAEPSPERFQ